MKKLFSLLMALCLLCAALPVVAENANSDRAAAIRAKFLEKAEAGVSIVRALPDTSTVSIAEVMRSAIPSRLRPAHASSVA